MIFIVILHLKHGLAEATLFLKRHPARLTPSYFIRGVSRTSSEQGTICTLLEYLYLTSDMVIVWCRAQLVP